MRRHLSCEAHVCTGKMQPTMDGCTIICFARHDVSGLSFVAACLKSFNETLCRSAAAPESAAACACGRAAACPSPLVQ